jgi:hypothetical protein
MFSFFFFYSPLFLSHPKQALCGPYFCLDYSLGDKHSPKQEAKSYGAKVGYFHNDRHAAGQQNKA